jgi:hypothetical protein
MEMRYLKSGFKRIQSWKRNVVSTVTERRQAKEWREDVDFFVSLGDF